MFHPFYCPVVEKPFRCTQYVPRAVIAQIPAAANMITTAASLAASTFFSRRKGLLNTPQSPVSMKPIPVSIGCLVSRKDHSRAPITMALAPANTDYIIAVARTYAQNDDFDKAFELLENKMNLSGSAVVLRIAKADILLRSGNNKQAIESYRQALLLKPDDYCIIESLGYCYVIDGQWAQAEKMFKTLSEESAGHKKTTLLETLAVCSMNAGEYGSAVDYYDQLSVEQRDNPEIWLKMGYAALGAGAPNQALGCAKRALAQKPGWPDAIALQGCGEYLNGRYTTTTKFTLTQFCKSIS